jgi:hypothetical protein
LLLPTMTTETTPLLADVCAHQPRAAWRAPAAAAGWAAVVHDPVGQSPMNLTYW